MYIFYSVNSPFTASGRLPAQQAAGWEKWKALWGAAAVSEEGPGAGRQSIVPAEALDRCWIACGGAERRELLFFQMASEIVRIV